MQCIETVGVINEGAFILQDAHPRGIKVCSRTLKLSPGTYYVYLEMVGQPSIQNVMSKPYKYVVTGP